MSVPRIKVTIKNRVRTITAGASLSAGYRAIVVNVVQVQLQAGMKIMPSGAVPKPWYAKTKYENVVLSGIVKGASLSP
jgi:hypothetical protein